MLQRHAGLNTATLDGLKAAIFDSFKTQADLRREVDQINERIEEKTLERDAALEQIEVQVGFTTDLAEILAAKFRASPRYFVDQDEDDESFFSVWDAYLDLPIDDTSTQDEPAAQSRLMALEAGRGAAGSVLPAPQETAEYWQNLTWAS